MKHMFVYGKIIQEEEKKRLTKQDIYMMLVIVTVALLLFAGFSIFGKKGSCAIVSYDGEEVLQISLSASEEKYYLLTGMDTESIGIQELTAVEWAAVSNTLQEKLAQEEYNVLACRNGQATMLQSSCPDQICVHHTGISKTGESIICLPHKLVIQITGTEEAELDGVVY